MPALAKKDLPVGDIEISKPVEKYMDKYMNKDKQPPEEEMIYWCQDMKQNDFNKIDPLTDCKDWIQNEDAKAEIDSWVQMKVIQESAKSFFAPLKPYLK